MISTDSEHGARYLLRRSYEPHTLRRAMGSIFWAESVGSISRAHVWTEFSEQELRAERGLGQLQAQSRTGAPQVFAPRYRSNDLMSA